MLIRLNQHFPLHCHRASCSGVYLHQCVDASPCADTAIGGLKATFLSSYIHTVYIYVVLCIFSIMVYATSPDLGSPSKVRIASPMIDNRAPGLVRMSFHDMPYPRYPGHYTPQHFTTVPPLQVWDNLNALAKINPVDGNLDGEYLTMLSKVGKPGSCAFSTVDHPGDFPTVQRHCVSCKALFNLAPARPHNASVAGPAG